MSGPVSRSSVLGDAVAVAVELGEDTGWELWSQAVAAHAAMPLPNSYAALQALMDEVRCNNRVCPQPASWLALYKLLLQHAARTEAGLPPRMPAEHAWRTTSSLDKRLCLRHQLEWAQAHGCLARIAALLRALPEADWDHMD